ncbi:unnamed protein product [Schistosoma curassoni]|uniref:Inositol-pentakisphosphate 2-kinase n=1 Tax=Schistosoma curassoni TaxID=6186 RepID=A0A183KXE1_9TREM|nr:unnamed protein product [Schistosoma curassoni]
MLAQQKCFEAILSGVLRSLRYISLSRVDSRFKTTSAIFLIFFRCFVARSEQCQFVNDRDRLIRGTLLKALLHKFDCTNDDTKALIPFNSTDRQPFSMHCALHADQKFHSTSCDSCHSIQRNCTLPDGCVLQRILSVQLLITTDIAFIFPHYKRVRTFLTSHGWTCCPLPSSVISGTCCCIPRMLISCAIIDLDPKPLDKLRDRLDLETAVAMEAINRQFKLLLPKSLS